MRLVYNLVISSARCSGAAGGERSSLGAVLAAAMVLGAGFAGAEERTLVLGSRWSFFHFIRLF